MIVLKRLLMLLIATLLAMVLVACGDVDEKTQAEPQEEKESNENDDVSEVEIPEDEMKEVSDEEIRRVANIDLDEFIETFNGMAEDGGFEKFERNGNESLTADGLLISVNEDGTVWGIVQPVEPTAFAVIATLYSIKGQSNDEDAEKIDVFLDNFSNAMDEKEELYIDELKIESMEINVSTINGDVFLFNVLGEEQP